MIIAIELAPSSIIYAYKLKIHRELLMPSLVVIALDILKIATSLTQYTDQLIL